jgi:Family of unknown function (DUF5372)
VSTVTVTRARDPLQGQRLRVLGRMRRHRGVELLVVLGDGSKRLVPAEWTDLLAPAADGSPQAAQPDTLGSVADLLAACAVVARLAARPVEQEPAKRAAVEQADVEQGGEQAARQSPGKEDDRAACPAQSAAGSESGATDHAHPGVTRRTPRGGARAAGAPDRPSGPRHLDRDGGRR